LTGAGTHAVRLTAVERALAGKPATKETIASASAAAGVDDVNSDIHASDDYRRAMVKVFTRRALEEALARA
jgi:carbon-monoxide dehydrogenase medium subunit